MTNSPSRSTPLSLFSSPPADRGHRDTFALLSSPISEALLTPPRQSVTLSGFESVLAGSSSSEHSNGRLIFGSIEEDFIMTPPASPAIKRKHQQPTLTSSFAAVASHANVNASSAVEKVASDEKRRRISTGWDELCRATVKARQAEEQRKRRMTLGTSLGGSRGLFQSSKVDGETDGHSESTSSLRIRAEGSTSNGGFSPFKLELPVNSLHTDDSEQDVRMSSEDEADFEGEEEDETSYTQSTRRGPIRGATIQPTRIGFSAMTNKLKAGQRIRRDQFTTLPSSSTVIPGKPTYLELYASHAQLDLYHAQPSPYAHRGREWSPAYSCAYSNSAKNAWMASEHSYAAVGTECGAVRIFDTNKSDMEQSEGWSAGETVGAHDPGVSMTQSQRDKSFKPRTGVVANHDNAIFDVKWSDDDAMIISTCADLSTAVWDTSRTGTTYEQSDRNDGLIARLRGHKASAKTSLWQGPSTIATAGRDGDIHIYDLRTSGRPFPGGDGMEKVSSDWKKRGHRAGDEAGDLWPVLSIRGAHGTPISKAKCAAARSVTTMVPIAANPHQIATGGPADGVIKLWDIRAGKQSKRYISEAAQVSPDRTLENGALRSRGIIHMVAAPKNGLIYALSSDSRITAYSQYDLTAPLAITYAHPDVTPSGYYLRLAISPCEKYIGCGSSKGSFHVWSAGQNTRNYLTRASNEGTVVEAGLEIGKGWHQRELHAIDWGHEQIMTCSDDCTTRVWRPSRAAYDAIAADPDEAKYDWAGIHRIS